MRLMIRVARAQDDEWVALREVALAESISQKYLSQLAHTLVAEGLLESSRGHGGGYRLARPADQIRAGDVLRAAEGRTASIACEGLDGLCPREGECTTLSFWEGLDQVIENYIDGATLADLARASAEPGASTTSRMLESLSRL